MAEPATRPADIVIVNATILPMGGGATIQNGVLKISGNSITDLGPATGLDNSTAKKRIDANGAVVMPGFVNCHTHIASNMLLRGLLEDVQLFEWLNTMWRLKRNFDEETYYRQVYGSRRNGEIGHHLFQRAFRRLPRRTPG